MERAPVAACLDTVTVCRLAQLNRSTLDYWVRTGLVRPSLRAEPGRRRSRLWTVQDAIVVRTVAELRSAGCSLQQIRTACDDLRDKWGSLRADTTLVWNGSDLLRIGRLGNVESLFKRPQQQVFRLVALPLGSWHREASSEVAYIREDAIDSGVPCRTVEAARKAV